MTSGPAEPLFEAAIFDAELSATTQPVKLFRDTLRRARALLEQRFHAHEDVVALVTHHAQFIDQLLVRAWRYHLGEASSEIALVAVGGYGRGELHPHSDIDIMLLAEEPALGAHGAALERFLLMMWDIGLDIGHSVRTPHDCIEQGREDITVATNIMEARLLSGPEPLFQAMRESTNRHHLWPGRDFFQAKWEEQIARHHKFHDTAYNLEPNVKEGPGGLRDIQMIGWVAKRHFGCETLDGLVEHHFLTEEEYQALIAGQSFLWRVRFGLHLLAKRREDRLLFDHQRNLATLFGYEDDTQHLAVEHFMKAYYRTVMELQRLNEMLLQLFQEEILYASESESPKPINPRFQSRKGFIEAVNDRVFLHTPFALLEIFLILAQQPALKGVRANTIRLIRRHRHLIDEGFRHDLRCRALFMELLRQPQGITHQLRRMNRYGILAHYLPVFGHVVGLMQHDLFHVYTVDEHTLTVVRNLRRFTIAEHHHEFPLCSKVSLQLAKPELLYIAGLFHDVAKGRGGDHSVLGAAEATAFCQQHGLSAYDTNLVSWLVRHHLIMSTTAQRKDISDPEVINQFASQIGNEKYLDYLYLLTVADIRATSPTVWNSWKDALLAELYHVTHKALRRGLSNPMMQGEMISERKREALKQLKLQRVTDTQIEGFWQRLGEEYFLRYSGSEIAWHTRAVLEHGNNPEPLVVLRQQTERGGTEIFLYTPIRGFQFTTSTTLLDQLGLNIVDARILPSRDNYTVDTYIVLENNGEPITGRQRLNEIKSQLQWLLSNPEQAPAKVHRRVARQLSHFPIPPRVIFHDDPHNERTIMEVVASDRPGLLSVIARVMAECRIKLQNAKVSTLGERVEDIFFITDEHNLPLHSAGRRALLEGKILQALES
ncbi:MAG: [protein-PII] uridylyltransferase [Gammaproteobacteria bacterium]|nr:[protein-PII] uridylyltransferase [Gammaproteobacteria bacterium]